MARLFSYKMTHDTGFAPNPFWGELTLATCKPQIRLKKTKGDWIAGFTSGELCGDAVGEEKLLFLMKVENKLSIADYFVSPQYKDKIPDPEHPLEVQRVGDNIYTPLPSGGFEQIDDSHHDCGNMEDDLSGEFVLTSIEFVYFGGEAITIPPQIRPSVPPGEHPHGWQTHDDELAEQFIKFVFRRGSGVLAAPHSWPAGDTSWNQP